MILTTGDLFRHAAIAAGFTLAAMIAMLAPFGGGSLNPARSLGPGMLASNPDIRGVTWIYVVAPLSAAVVLGIFLRWLVPLNKDSQQEESGNATGTLGPQGANTGVGGFSKNQGDKMQEA